MIIEDNPEGKFRKFELVVIEVKWNINQNYLCIACYTCRGKNTV